MYEETRTRSKRWYQFSLSSLLVVMVVVAAYLGGRASLRPGRNVDLSGPWLLTTVSGHQHPVTLQGTGDGQYILGPRALNNSGIYRLQDDQLTLVQPNHAGKNGFVWKVLNRDKLVLVAQPPIARTGSDYLGSTLQRQSGNAPQASPPAPRKRASSPSAGKPPVKPAGTSDDGAAAKKRLAAKVQGMTEPNSQGLGGTWQLTLPAGFQRAMVLEPVGDQRYRLLPGGLNFSGVYELRDKDLVIVEPRRPELAGYRWQLTDQGTWLLIEQPAVSTGASYLGATLERADVDLPAMGEGHPTGER